MATSLWSGTVSFGLVAIPVKMFTASRSHEISFNQLHKETGNRIRYRKVDEGTGEEVSQRDIVRGFEVSDGEWVTIDDKEIANLRPEATKTLDIEDFVDIGEIDPIYFEKTYYLVPEDNLAARRGYGLLLDAMQDRERAGIGTMVIRSKQYLACVRPLGDHLVVSTMKFADEIVDPARVPELDVTLPKVDAKARTMATSLIDSLTTEFDPSKFSDTFTDEVRALIDKKARGETITPAEKPAESPKVVDLMAALEASVKAAKEARSGHPSSGSGSSAKSGASSSDTAGHDDDHDADTRHDDPQDDEATASHPARAKKATAKKAAAKPRKKASAA